MIELSGDRITPVARADTPIRAVLDGRGVDEFLAEMRSAVRTLESEAR